MATLELDLTQPLEKKTFDMKDYDTLKLSLEKTTEVDFLDSIQKVTYSKTTMKVTANDTTFTFKNVSSDMVLEVFDKNTSSDVYNHTFDDFNTLFNKTLIIPDSSRGKTTYNCKGMVNLCVPATATGLGADFVSARAAKNTVTVTIKMETQSGKQPITLTLKNCDSIENVWCKKSDQSLSKISGFDRDNSYYAYVMNYATKITEVDKKGGSTVTGSIWDDTIRATGYNLYKDKEKKQIDYTNLTKKGVTINANNGADTIYGSRYSDTINGGDGGDTIYSSTGNDTISGGKGVNNIIYNSSTFGHDTVKLTKGETLNITNNYFSSYAQGSTKGTKNDLVLKRNDDNDVIIKNYFAKDTGAVVNINGHDLTKETGFLDDITASNYFDKEGQKAVRKYTGSALADKVDAREVKQLKDRRGNLLDTGVTLNTGLGDDIIYGSKYNDTITGGKGDNTIYHYAGEGDDTIVLTKGENLTLHLADIKKGNLTYSSDKKGNLVISYTQDDKSGSVILKNFYKKDTTGADTYVKLITSDETIDNMRTDLFLDTVKTSKNYTGSWLAENIVGQLEAPTNKKKNTGLTLNGGAGDDKITGTQFNDTIKGGNGDDTIYGGEGNDNIYGEGGNNTIYFSEGDGEDTVYSGKGNDSLIFTNIDMEKMERTQDKKDLVITYGEGDSVRIKDYYKKANSDVVNQKNSVKSISFVSDDGNDTIYLGSGESTVKIDMSVFDSTVHDEGTDCEWTEYNENCTKTIYLNSDTSSTLTIDIDKEIFDGKALGVFCRGTGLDNDLYISLDGGDGYCIRVKDYFDENGDPKTDRVKLNVWEYPEQFSTELVQKQYTVPEWTDGSIWGNTFDIQPFDKEFDFETTGVIHGMNIDNSWLLHSSGFGNDIIYGGNGNKETIYIRGGKDIVHANEGNKNISISGNQSDCDIYLGKEKTTKTNINLGAVEGNVTSNIKSGDLEINWDCYADSDETTYTSKLRVAKWDEKTSQATIGISGNDRDNTLNAVDGVENIIDGGKGDDILIGGDGIDTFNFTYNSEYGIDTIKNYTSDDILQFESASSFPVDFSKFKYYTNNNGKGLVINTTDLYNKESYVIIDNYFETDNKIDKVTTYNWSNPDEEKSLATMYGDKSSLGSFDLGTDGVYAGTDNVDVFIAKSGINTYTGGKGSDTLTSNDGENTFVFNSGDGSDTLYQKGGTITLKFNDATIEELSSPTGYDRDANGYYSDLLIHYDGNENTLRVKDYFYKNYVTKIIDSTGNEYNMTDYFKYVVYPSDLSHLMGTSKNEEIRVPKEGIQYANFVAGGTGSDKIWASNLQEWIYTGRYENYVTYDSTSGIIDEIHAGDGDDYIYATSETNILYGDSGDDTIFVLAGAKNIISDSEGSDIISINSYNDSDNANYQNLHIVFNIDNSGNVDDAGLRILTNTEFELWQTDTNHADIKGINIVKDSSGNGGYNCIETFIDANDYEVSMSVIEIVKNDIASWLTANEYASVSDVFTNEKIDGDITILLGKFDITDKWQ